MNDWEILKKHEEAINRIGGPAGYHRLIGKHAPILMQGIKYIDHIKGLKVLDAGCNAGILSFVASRFCPEVVGVEQDETSCGIFKELYDYFKKSNISEYNIDRVQLLQCSVGEIDEKLEFEGVIAYNILYHLSPKDLERMTKIISGCSRVIVQCKKKARLASWENRLHLPARVLEYLSNLGFHCEVKEPENRRPIILGSRK